MIPSSKSGSWWAGSTQDNAHSGSSCGLPHRLRQKGPFSPPPGSDSDHEHADLFVSSMRHAAARRYGSSRASVGGFGHSGLNTPSFLLPCSRQGSAWSTKCLITPRLCPARWPCSRRHAVRGMPATLVTRGKEATGAALCTLPALVVGDFTNVPVMLVVWLGLLPLVRWVVQRQQQRVPDGMLDHEPWPRASRSAAISFCRGELVAVSGACVLGRGSGPGRAAASDSVSEVGSPTSGQGRAVRGRPRHALLLAAVA